MFCPSRSLPSKRARRQREKKPHKNQGIEILKQHKKTHASGERAGFFFNFPVKEGERRGENWLVLITAVSDKSFSFFLKMKEGGGGGGGGRGRQRKEWNKHSNAFVCSSSSSSTRKKKLSYYFKKRFFFCRFSCTIMTSETELMDRTYMVTPTVTGVPVSRWRRERKGKRKEEEKEKKN